MFQIFYQKKASDIAEEKVATPITIPGREKEAAWFKHKADMIIPYMIITFNKSAGFSQRISKL